MTASQATELALPYLAVLSTLIGVPLFVKLLQLLNVKAAAIGDARVRSLAVVAVRFVEQTLATAPSEMKKKAAVNFLVTHGVPADVAGPLTEAAVHAVTTSAQQVLATPAGEVLTQTVTPGPTSTPPLPPPKGP